MLYEVITANAVNQNYKSKKVILFGSFAKGNFNEDSDIDIALVFDDYENLIEMQLGLMKIRRDIDSRIEPHPFRERDFDITSPIVYEILKHGQEIM